MINYLIELTGWWLLFYLLYYILLRNRPTYEFGRFYLLVGLCAGLLLPFAELPGLQSPLDTEFRIVSEYFYVPDGATTRTGEMSTPSAGLIPFIIYSIGLLAGLGLLIKDVYHVLHLHQKGKLDTIFDHKIVVHHENLNPFSIWKHIFIPSEVTKMTDQEQRAIIIHELAHIRAGHMIDLILLKLVRIILWFHPLPFLYQKEIRDLHEYQADKQVLLHFKKHEYGRILLRFATEGQTGIPVPYFSNFSLKKRIKMFNKKTTSQNATAKNVAMTLFSLFLVIFLLACKEDLNINNVQQPFMNVLEEVVVVGYGKTNPDLPDSKFSKSNLKSNLPDVLPVYPGCENAREQTDQQACSTRKLLEFIYKEITYPELARTHGVEGLAAVQFEIDQKGEIGQIYIVRDLGATIGDTIKAVFDKLKAEGIKFSPAQNGGKPVPVQYTIPVKFLIEE